MAATSVGVGEMRLEGSPSAGGGPGITVPRGTSSSSAPPAAAPNATPAAAPAAPSPASAAPSPASVGMGEDATGGVDAATDSLGA
eukprot:1698605-Prymnesium_polylepis.1